jgi:hypothetical protein
MSSRDAAPEAPQRHGCVTETLFAGPKKDTVNAVRAGRFWGYFRNASK